MLRRSLVLASAALVASAGVTLAQQKSAAAAPAAATLDTASVARFHFRYAGPEGNRVTSVAGVAGNPMVYYAGAASGGVWKTTDGGIHWKPIFDKEPVSSIGSVSVALSDPNVVWVGTGEPFIRSHISMGWGMFKSTDAGATWTRAGLEKSGRISRIVIDPHDPDRVFVAALGSAYGPQPERGIFRTTDGGKTWDKVLFVNDSTGGGDVLMDPTNPHVLYAAMWQLEVHTWGRVSGGAGSGIWKSTDGGTTWKRITEHGLPTKPVGKIQLGVSAANPQRVYASIETGDGIMFQGKEADNGHLWRSDDAGATWELVNSDHQIAGRTAYYDRFGVTPDNADEAYFLSANWLKTLDGGKTMIDPPQDEIPYGDHHDIWFDPQNGNRFIVSHDGGVSITTNRTKSWLRVHLPIAQMYHVTVDDRVPYWIYGNRQDGPSAAGPSNARLVPQFGGDPGIPASLWRTVGGGESGFATPDPQDSNLVWSTGSGFGSGGGIVSRYDFRTNMMYEVEVWPKLTVGWGADSLKLRFNWEFPLTISPWDHNTVYVGSQYVHVTKDGGQSWQMISPDLTKNDKSRQVASGGLTPDNIGVEYSGVVFAIAESPKQKGLIWAGTNDGNVQVTRDGGQSWTNVTANLPGAPAWGTIDNIEPSHYDAGTAYLTIDGHQANNFDPWVYKTTDYGKTWKLITNGLAKTPVSYAHIVREDPVRKGLLYLGTEGGMYISFDDGANWQSFQSNLPYAPVYWIAVQERFSDLVIATYGRGFYIVDDITPLRTIDASTMGEALHLFAPRAATYRFRAAEAPYMAEEDRNGIDGWTPPYGAGISFWVKKAGDKDSATVTIADSAGTTVRTMTVAAKTGLNRTWWDLRGERTTEARIRVSPPGSPWFTVNAEGHAAPAFGRYALLQPPGKYTVTVTLGKEKQSQSFVVLKDPATSGSAATIAEQMTFEKGVMEDINATADLVNNIEKMRAQLALMKAQASGADKARQVAVIDSMDAKLVQVEGELRQVRATGRGQDANRQPSRIAEHLLYLVGTVGNSDMQPTSQAKAVAKELHDELMNVKARADALLAKNPTGVKPVF